MIEQKAALITGGAAGIGKGIVLRLADDGFAVALNDLNGELAENTAKEVRAKNVPCLVVPADVSDEKQVKQMVDKVIAGFGRIDVLINNAGICPVRMFETVTPSDFERTIKINLVSMFIVSKYVAPHMAERGGGRIVNASSQSAFRETVATIEYCTSKWGVRGLTRVLAECLAPQNITVNAYCPGTVITEMQDKIAAQVEEITGLEKEDYFSMAESEIPLGRFQDIGDIAALVSFLVSDGAKNITGQNILVNGGLVKA